VTEAIDAAAAIPCPNDGDESNREETMSTAKDATRIRIDELPDYAS